MLGAIAGDIIGSVYEFQSFKSTEFPLFHSRANFTDDSVLTIALADSILSGRSFVDTMLDYVNRYPDRGYGTYFYKWVFSEDHQPYGSFGNGAGMRISPVAYAWNTRQEVLDKAAEYTAVTHNHPEGIKGGQATALAIFMARTGASKSEIKDEIQSTFGYNLDRSVDEIRPRYFFNGSCQGTVPEAIIAFLDSNSFEHAIRLSVSLGGDADTLACITGSIAEPFYGGVPIDIEVEVYKHLDPDLKALVRSFIDKYCKQQQPAE